MNREQCISELTEKVKNLRCWKNYYCGTNIVRSEESNEPIPPYIPQVGNRYFGDNGTPRILMYAMNANIKQNNAAKIINDSKGKDDNWIYTRLNDEENGEPTIHKHIGPYKHMNMLARMLISAITKDDPLRYGQTVNFTSATNLIKCSTTAGASTPNLIMYGNCTRKTCSHEIGLLRPEIIITMGSNVFYSLAHSLGFEINNNDGMIARPLHPKKDDSLPKAILFVYHSTGPIMSHFKNLQNYFEDNKSNKNIKKRPRSFKPYLKMLTGKDYNETYEYWEDAKNKFEFYREKLEDKFDDFVKTPGYFNNRFYFACHFGLFKNIQRIF